MLLRALHFLGLTNLSDIEVDKYYEIQTNAALGAAMMWYRSALSKDQDSDVRNWRFNRSQFPAIKDSELEGYVKAYTTLGRRRILARIIRQGMQRIEVSKEPFTENESVESVEMLDVSKVPRLPKDDGEDG